MECVVLPEGISPSRIVYARITRVNVVPKSASVLQLIMPQFDVVVGFHSGARGILIILL